MSLCTHIGIIGIAGIAKYLQLAVPKTQVSGQHTATICIGSKFNAKQPHKCWVVLLCFKFFWHVLIQTTHFHSFSWRKKLIPQKREPHSATEADTSGSVGQPLPGLSPLPWPARAWWCFPTSVERQGKDPAASSGWFGRKLVMIRITWKGCLFTHVWLTCQTGSRFACQNSRKGLWWWWNRRLQVQQPHSLVPPWCSWQEKIGKMSQFISDLDITVAGLVDQDVNGSNEILPKWIPSGLLTCEINLVSCRSPSYAESCTCGRTWIKKRNKLLRTTWFRRPACQSVQHLWDLCKFACTFHANPSSLDKRYSTHPYRLQ